jgi:hypothetical protein
LLLLQRVRAKVLAGFHVWCDSLLASCAKRFGGGCTICQLLLLLLLLLLQRVRAKVLAGFEKTFKDCDVIMTPATAMVAPALQQNAAGGLKLPHPQYMLHPVLLLIICQSLMRRAGYISHQS